MADRMKFDIQYARIRSATFMVRGKLKDKAVPMGEAWKVFELAVAEAVAQRLAQAGYDVRKYQYEIRPDTCADGIYNCHVDVTPVPPQEHVDALNRRG